MSGFSENPRWKVFGTPIPARADFKVYWEGADGTNRTNVPDKKWPQSMWIYSLQPRKFSPGVVSNVMAALSFTDKDKLRQDSKGMLFKNGERDLFISFSPRCIQFQMRDRHYTPTTLAQDVPTMAEMPRLTQNFLQIVGVDSSEIERDTNGAPNFDFWEPKTVFYLKSGHLTNIEFRAVVFRRAVDGARVIGNAGYCQVHFGEHSKISQIDFTWPDLKRIKAAPTIKPQTVLQLMREGKAHEGLVPDDFGPIDWSSVKSVTVNQARPSYFGGDSMLYPFLCLWTTVETPHGSVDIETDCPIIDEGKF